MSRAAKQRCKPTLDLDTFSKMVRNSQNSRLACRMTDTMDFGYYSQKKSRISSCSLRLHGERTPNVCTVAETAKAPFYRQISLSNLFPMFRTAARIKKVLSRVPGAKPKTKFKVRCSRYIYTLSLDDSDKAEKLKQTLPPGQLLFLHSVLVSLTSFVLDMQA
jgi:hypothetical protein